MKPSIFCYDQEKEKITISNDINSIVWEKVGKDDAEAAFKLFCEKQDIDDIDLMRKNRIRSWGYK